MKRFIYILLSMFALVSCLDRNEWIVPGPARDGDIRVAVRIPRFEDVEVATKGTKNGAEQKVTNMYMFIIDNSGNVADRQSFEGDKPLFTIDRGELERNNKVVTEAKILVIANYTEAVKGVLDAASNLDEIYACDFALSSGTDCIDIPEAGFPMMSDEYPVDLSQPADSNNDPLKGAVLEIPLNCLYAKVLFNIAVNPSQPVPSVDQSFHLTSWQVFNVPTKLNIGVPGEETKFAKEGCSWVKSDKRTTTNKADNIIYESSQESDSLSFFFYVPEHKIKPGNTADYPWAHGVTYNESDYTTGGKYETYADYRQYLKPTLVYDKTTSVHPAKNDQKAIYVEIKGIYKDHNNLEREVTYTIYLGDDNFSNFHLLRNHQYNNTIDIKGIKNSTSVEDETWITYDHRVNVKQEDFTFGLERETLLDSHWEIRPIRIDFNNVQSTDAVVEIIVPNECNWIGIESPSNATITANRTKANYCDVDNTDIAYGKRRYFTDNLVSTLTAKKITISRKNTTDHTIANINGHDAHTVWAYIDEYNSTENGAAPRYATITCNYYSSNAVYNNGKGTPTVTEKYIFRQNNLHKITYNGHTYYIEYYEEYLYNFDSKEQYGNTTDGMEWGLDGDKVSFNDIALYASGTFSGITNSILKPVLSNKKYFYDFYLRKDIRSGMNVNNEAIHERDGLLFTQRVMTGIDKTGSNSILATNETPKSAIEYCVNRNKRMSGNNQDGQIDLDKIKWYLPGIDEIEEICKGGYGDFEVFQDKYYWSSQPAYSIWYWKYDAHSFGIGNTNGYMCVDNIYRARATKVDDNFNTVNSGETGNVETQVLVESNTGFNARIGDPQSYQGTPTYDVGNQPRTNINRVRCVYKAN